jgi:beta-glucosidase
MPRVYSVLLAVLIAINNFGQTSLPYKDPDLPIDKRVKDLLSRMTAEEKFWQLFMIPGDLSDASPGQYKNGLFGLQVSAVTKPESSLYVLRRSDDDPGGPLTYGPGSDYFDQQYFIRKDENCMSTRGEVIISNRMARELLAEYIQKQLEAMQS